MHSIVRSSGKPVFTHTVHMGGQKKGSGRSGLHLSVTWGNYMEYGLLLTAVLGTVR